VTVPSVSRDDGESARRFRWPTACIAAILATQALGAGAKLTADQLVERNTAARGSLEAWRKIDSMAWSGHASSSGGLTQPVPFQLDQQRPNKTRFELAVQNQKAVRVFDGKNGWKLRPIDGGKPDVQPYSEEETRFALESHAIDGPLMDDAAQGGSFTLGGVDTVDGHKAYLVNVSLPSGLTHRIWLDAKTYLEVRFEREFRKASGELAVASVSYRDYKAFEGLELPTTIETSADKDKPANKLVIDEVLLNPPLDPRVFTKPQTVSGSRHGTTVDTRGAAQTTRP
jgi:outer membrane lipoprotein-sorting protein